jgi:hypothetical protein
MRSAATIDKQINTYLGQLNPKEKEVVLGVVKTFVENRHEDDLLEDKNLVKEMDRRFKDLLHPLAVEDYKEAYAWYEDR